MSHYDSNIHELATHVSIGLGAHRPLQPGDKRPHRSGHLFTDAAHPTSTSTLDEEPGTKPTKRRHRMGAACTPNSYLWPYEMTADLNTVGFAVGAAWTPACSSTQASIRSYAPAADPTASACNASLPSHSACAPGSPPQHPWAPPATPSGWQSSCASNARSSHPGQHRHTHNDVKRLGLLGALWHFRPLCRVAALSALRVLLIHAQYPGAGEDPFIAPGHQGQQLDHIAREWDGPFALHLVADGQAFHWVFTSSQRRVSNSTGRAPVKNKVCKLAEATGFCKLRMALNQAADCSHRNPASSI